MKRSILLAALAVVCACSDPGSPGPSNSSRWHVTSFGLGFGTLSPATFDVIVTEVGTDSFRVSMPAITWSVGSVRFDSTMGLIGFSDTANYGFFRLASHKTEYCQFMDVWGRMNAGRDTLKSATVQVISGDTAAGGFCVVNTSGSATVTKQ
jgi:hypothetical protein